MPMPPLTRTQRFAAELLMCRLSTAELAHAMGWTMHETREFHRHLRARFGGPVLVMSTRSSTPAPATSAARAAPPSAATT
jgi:hypothetical protein